VRELANFTRSLVHHLGVKPLGPEDVESEAAWIEGSRYPEWRKEELRRCLLDNPVLKEKHCRCKSFVKTETYPDFKYPRNINSRHDRFKIYTGPFFHAVEKALFKLPMFVKYVPVRERAKYIAGYLNLSNMACVGTDYTSFEAWFVPAIMHAVEFQLYAYMARCLPKGKEMMRWIRHALSGRNRCFSRDFRYSVKGVRMSGDMCTSLGNGFTNYVLMRWVCHRQGITCLGLVEGDDGLFQVSRVPDVSDFESVGFKIKMEVHASVDRAGFCKQYFDARECRAVVDVRELLAKFGWTHAVMRDGGPVTMEALLRAKAASLRSEVPSCPIAVALVRYVDRVIGRKGRLLFEGPRGDPGYREDLAGDPVELEEPTALSRALVSDLFGVSVDEQKAVEKYLDGLTQLQELEGPVTSLMKPVWCEYARRFCRYYPAYVDRRW